MARVLIVDDALIMRKMIAKVIEGAGHVVVDEAANGEQAIEMYQKHQPDIVTMDITMPVMDGIQALTHIIEYDTNAKVIMVSALGQQHKVMESLDRGAKGYILKPITGEKILAVIKQLIGVAENCSLTSTQVAFECGEGRIQKNCDAAFSAFICENKDNCFLFTIKNEFSCDDFKKLMTAVQEMLVVNPIEIIFNFIHNNVLNGKVVNSFIDILSSISHSGKKLRVICYNQDYMNFFRNVVTLEKVDFSLVKKV